MNADKNHLVQLYATESAKKNGFAMKPMTIEQHNQEWKESLKKIKKEKEDKAFD